MKRFVVRLTEKQIATLQRALDTFVRAHGLPVVPDAFELAEAINQSEEVTDHVPAAAET